jgi:hypothetical protein
MFVITLAHIAHAVRHSKGKCVVALALKGRTDIANVLIGASVSTVTFTSGRVVRYKTPAILRDGLNKWDRTGVWDLPVGKYYLDIPDKPPTVKYKKHKSKNKVTVYANGRKHAPAVNPRHIEFLRRKRAA